MFFLPTNDVVAFPPLNCILYIKESCFSCSRLPAVFPFRCLHLLLTAVDKFSLARVAYALGVGVGVGFQILALRRVRASLIGLSHRLLIGGA